MVYLPSGNMTRNCPFVGFAWMAEPGAELFGMNSTGESACPSTSAGPARSHMSLGQNRPEMPAIIHPDREESQVVALPERDTVSDLVPKRFAPRLRHAQIFVCLIDRSRHHAVRFGVLRHGLQILRMQHYRRT